MNIGISWRRTAVFLAVVTCLLAAASLAGQVARYTINHGEYKWYTGLFDVDREQNIPSWWQGTVILTSAVLLTIVAVQKRRQRDYFRWQWAGLAGLFFLLAVDEMCSLHEQLGRVLSSRGVHLHGAFEYQWVIPGMVIASVVGLIYLRFLWKMPRGFAIWFAVAGVIHVSGAIGIEMWSASYAARFGDNNLSFQLIATLEEVMEMTGMAIFLVSLVRYASEHVPRVTLSFDSESMRAGGDGVFEVTPSGHKRPRIAA